MLIGERVVLRDVAWGDFEAREVWFGDEDVTRYLGALKGRAGEKLEDGPGRGLEWTVALRETGEPVGIAQLARIDEDAGQASLGLVIGRKDLWGRGLGRDVLSVLLTFAFEVMQLNRISLTVEARHVAARHLYEKVGFRTEGRLREARRTPDGLQDVLVMALLKREWRGLRDGGPGEAGPGPASDRPRPGDSA